MHQKRYAEALRAHEDARNAFVTLGEPQSVAAAWHQIGLVHDVAGRPQAAEDAYRRSLSIEVQQGNLSGQEKSLAQLGNLYSRTGRTEESIALFRQATDLAVKLRDRAGEGSCRHNLAGQLMQSQRYDEARAELLRAIELKKEFGHAAGPWRCWGLLEALERATGRLEQASVARGNAMQAYSAYRRAGGHSQSRAGLLFTLVAAAETAEQRHAAASKLAEISTHPQASPALRSLLSKLEAVLAGQRDPALADDAELDAMDAVELRLLIESSTSH